MQADPTRQDILLDLNFVPTWARKPPSANPYHGRDLEDDSRSAPRSPRDQGRRDERRQGAGRRPPGGPFRREGGGPGREEHRPAQPGRETGPRHAPPPRVDIPVEIHFIPEKKRLGAVVRQIRSSNRAYPLMDVAALFLNSPDSHMIKLEVRRGAPSQELQFFQCEVCKAAYLKREDVLEHVIGDHLDAYFVAEDVETEPPSGQFVCVGRCTLSGELVGPPNYHGFEDRIRELQRERFPDMTYDDYRAQMEMVHDEELIEQWKRQASRQRRYRLKDAPEGTAATLSWLQARAHLAQQLSGSYATGTVRVMIPPGTGRAAGDPAVRHAMRRAWNRESRQPHTLAIALRPAFKHMGLHLFKAGEGITFVSAVKPKPLDAGHAIDAIREVVTYLHDNPGCTRQRLLEVLRPQAEQNLQLAAEVLNPLRWLIERGHVIEFFNGTLSVPISRSKAQL